MLHVRLAMYNQYIYEEIPSGAFLLPFNKTFTSFFGGFLPHFITITQCNE